MRLLPHARYWPGLTLGTLVVLLVNATFAVPFLATALASALLLVLYPKPRPTWRKFFAFFSWLGGIELALIGLLMILGLGLFAPLSAAATQLIALFTLEVGVLLGAVLLALGVASFIIGNWLIGDN